MKRSRVNLTRNSVYARKTTSPDTKKPISRNSGRRNDVGGSCCDRNWLRQMTGLEYFPMLSAQKRRERGKKICQKRHKTLLGCCMVEQKSSTLMECHDIPYKSIITPCNGLWRSEQKIVRTRNLASGTTIPKVNNVQRPICYFFLLASDRDEIHSVDLSETKRVWRLLFSFSISFCPKAAFCHFCSLIELDFDLW